MCVKQTFIHVQFNLFCQYVYNMDTHLNNEMFSELFILIKYMGSSTEIATIK